MADDNEPIGSLPVEITGDFSELQTALNDAATAAQDGSDQIVSALQGVIDASGLAGGDLNVFKSVLEADQQAGIELAQSLQDLSESASSVGEAIAGAAASALEQLQQAEQDAGEAAANTAIELNDESQAAEQVSESSHEAESALAEMAESFLALGEALAIIEGLKEFVEEAIEVYGQTQQVVTSLELLGQTSEEAEETISGLADMSLNLAIPFGDLEQATRRLSVAFQGVEEIDINDVLTTAANSAALTGKSFDQVTTALQRIEVTGAVTSRQLLQLGVTWQQLADTAGTSVEAVQAVLKKGGQDATADLQLVMNTINSMASGAAAAQAQTVLGQITVLKNQVELLFDAIGQDIAPLVATIVSGLSEAIQVARDMATEFQALPEPVKDVAIALAAAATAVVPLALGIGALGIGINAVAGIVPAYNALMAQLGLAAEADAIAETEAAVATGAHGVAALEATPEIEGLALAEGEAAAAATGAATGLGTLGTEAAAAGGATVEAGAGIEAAGVSMGAMAGLAGIALVGITGIISGMRDAATQAEELKGVIDEFGAGITALGGPLETFLDGMKILGVNTNQVAGPLRDVTEAGDIFVTTMNEINASLATEAWKSFSNVMTGQLGPGIQYVTGELKLWGTALGLLKNEQDTFSDDEGAWIETAIDGFSHLSSGAQSVIDHIAKLNQDVSDGKTVLAELKAASDGSAESLQAIAAQSASVEKAQKTLATALGDTTKATKSAGDAISDLATADQNAQAKFDNANESWANMMTAFQNGSGTINGLAINTNTLNTAWNNLAAAYLKATGAALQWNEASGNTAGIVQGQVNQFTNLQNAVAQTAAALKVQQDAYNAAVAAGTANDQMLQQLQIAYIANQKANDSFAKAVDTTGTSMEELTGKSQDYVQVLVNGIPTVAGYTNAQMDAARAADDIITAFGGEAHMVNDLLNAYAQKTAAEQGNTTGVRNLTQAQIDATTAANNFAIQQQKVNQAWQDGKIVMLNYAGVLVQETTAATDAANAQQTLDDKVKQLATDNSSLGEVSNETADALLAEAAAADDAASAIDNLNNATSRSSKGGGANGSFEAYISDAIGIAQSAATGGALGGGGVGQAYVDQMAQELANATDQVVTTMDGTFIPAAQQAATLLAAQALYTQNANTSTSSNTEATNANTAATATSTDAITQTTDASTAAATATQVLATAATAAAEGTTALGASVLNVTSTVDQAITAVANASSDVMGIVQTFTGVMSNSPFSGSPASIASAALGSSAYGSSLYGSYQNPNPGLMEGYAPSDGQGATIIVTGNFVASDQSIQMLAQKTASAAVNQLRTLGGLKN